MNILKICDLFYKTGHIEDYLACHKNTTKQKRAIRLKSRKINNLIIKKVK